MKKTDRLVRGALALLLVLCLLIPTLAENVGSGENTGAGENAETEGNAGTGGTTGDESIMEMSQYYDSGTGFGLEYPSLFQFEETGGNTARSADGKASLTIENLKNEDGALTEEMILGAIQLELADTEPKKYEQNGCLRTDREIEGGKRLQTDLYLVLANSFHHITIQYPAKQRDMYEALIERMVDTMGTEQTELG